MTGKARYDFGDGQATDVTEDDKGHSTARHDFTVPGTYTIRVTDQEGRRGWVNYVVPYQQGQRPAAPVLTIPDLSVKQGQSDATQDTTMENSSGESQKCTGKLTIKGGSGLDTKLTMTMPDFWGAGNGDESVTFAVDGSDLVGTYGSSKGGFPIVDPLHGATTNHWSAADDAAVGEHDVHTEILAEDKTVLASADWKLTVTAKT